MTVAERIAKVNSECAGVWGQSGISSWEKARLEEWKDREKLTDKQDAILQQIERKAFGTDTE